MYPGRYIAAYVSGFLAEQIRSRNGHCHLVTTLIHSRQITVDGMQIGFIQKIAGGVIIALSIGVLLHIKRPLTASNITVRPRPIINFKNGMEIVWGVGIHQDNFILAKSLIIVQRSNDSHSNLSFEETIPHAKKKDRRRLPPALLLSLVQRGSLVHAAHAAHAGHSAAAAGGGRRVLFGALGDQSLGRQDQARDGGRVLQGRPGDFGRVDDALRH